VVNIIIAQNITYNCYGDVKGGYVPTPLLAVLLFPHPTFKLFSFFPPSKVSPLGLSDLGLCPVGWVGWEEKQPKIGEFKRG
jgi:hypothetical protein